MNARRLRIEECCEVCEKWITLVSNPLGVCDGCKREFPGVFRVHGPRNNRCPGSGHTWWESKGLKRAAGRSL